MSIHFISGKPGGGKTLYSVRLILDELLYGDRMILTNVPLNVGRLNEYIQTQTSKVVDVVGRVWVLSDEEAAKFWTLRPDGVRIKQLSKEAWQRGDLPSYAEVKDHGVMYVLDEIHNYFGARQWAETGRDVIFYLSQHRKLGDTVVCITQAIGNVDKQFRSVTQDFTFIRNLGKEKYGKFRLPQLFIRKSYSSPPTDTTEPMETGTFRLDVSGLASCYDSAAGVGIHGKMADRNERKSGLPFWAYFVAVGLLVLFLFYFLPGQILKLFGGSPSVALAQVKQSPVVAYVPPELPTNRPVTVALAGPLASSSVVSEQESVKVCGIAQVGRRIHFFLSNGRDFYSNDPFVTEVSSLHVVYKGQRYEFR